MKGLLILVSMLSLTMSFSQEDQNVAFLNVKEGAYKYYYRDYGDKFAEGNPVDVEVSSSNGTLVSVNVSGKTFVPEAVEYSRFLKEDRDSDFDYYYGLCVYKDYVIKFYFTYNGYDKPSSIEIKAVYHTKKMKFKSFNELEEEFTEYIFSNQENYLGALGDNKDKYRKLTAEEKKEKKDREWAKTLWQEGLELLGQEKYSDAGSKFYKAYEITGYGKSQDSEKYYEYSKLAEFYENLYYYQHILKGSDYYLAEQLADFMEQIQLPEGEEDSLATLLVEEAKFQAYNFDVTLYTSLYDFEKKYPTKDPKTSYFQCFQAAAKTLNWIEEDLIDGDDLLAGSELSQEEQDRVFLERNLKTKIVQLDRSGSDGYTADHLKDGADGWELSDCSSSADYSGKDGADGMNGEDGEDVFCYVDEVILDGKAYVRVLFVTYNEEASFSDGSVYSSGWEAVFDPKELNTFADVDLSGGNGETGGEGGGKGVHLFGGPKPDIEKYARNGYPGSGGDGGDSGDLHLFMTTKAQKYQDRFTGTFEGGEGGSMGYDKWDNVTEEVKVGDGRMGDFGDKIVKEWDGDFESIISGLTSY